MLTIKSNLPRVEGDTYRTYIGIRSTPNTILNMFASVTMPTFDKNDLC